MTFRKVSGGVSKNEVGTCDYCVRTEVVLSPEAVLDDRFVVNNSVRVRQMCLDQKECRAQGGDPPDPKPRTVSGSKRFQVNKTGELFLAQEFAKDGSPS